MLSYRITDEATKSLKRISELTAERAAFFASLPQDTRDAIYRAARVSTIGSTTRIENAVLTDSEIRWLDETLSADGRPTAFAKEKRYIEKKLSKERERSIEEVAGCRDMLAIIFSQAKELFPLTPTTIKGFHKELLQFYPPAAHYLGRYKIAPNSVVETVEGTSIRKAVLKTADPGPITDAAMRDLIDWYNKALPDSPWPIAVAAEFVFRFLAIHPFQDGNGRIGRALFSFALLQAEDRHLNVVVPALAIDRHIEKRKEEYYLALRRCSGGRFLQDSRKYRIGYFLMFMLRIFTEALENDIDYYARRHAEFLRLAPAPNKILACFQESPEKMLGLSEVMQSVKLAKRTAIHALGALVQKGFLQKSGSGPTRKYRITF